MFLFAFINYYKNLPENWAIIPLKYICDVYGGKRLPAGMKFSDNITQYKYLRVTDMKNQTIVGCAYISNEIYNLINKYIVNEDDIYITVAGTIGNIGIIPKEYHGSNLTENADKLILNNNIYKPWFVMFLQSSACQKQITDCTTKVGQPKLAIKRIEDIIVALPPLKEQIQIVNFTNKIINYL